jgi:hypothetical protein
VLDSPGAGSPVDSPGIAGRRKGSRDLKRFFFEFRTNGGPQGLENVWFFDIRARTEFLGRLDSFGFGKATDENRFLIRVNPQYS